MRLGDDFFTLVASLVADAFGVGQQGVGPRQVRRQLPAYLVEQGENVGPVDHAGRRHGDRASALDDLTELVELVVDLHWTSWGSIRTGCVAAGVWLLATLGMGRCAARQAHAVGSVGVSAATSGASTGPGTSPSTSPPKATTSLIRLEDRNE